MKQGFTIIEMAIVIAIIGILLTIGIPRFTRVQVKPGELFIGSLNELTQEGARAAQYQAKVQKILFDFVSQKVELLDIDSKTAKKSIALPKELEIKDFSINRKSQFGAGVQKYSAYFLINTQGITQDVKISMVDHSINSSPNVGSYEITLNPITAQFSIT